MPMTIAQNSPVKPSAKIPPTKGVVYAIAILAEVKLTACTDVKLAFYVGSYPPVKNSVSLLLIPIEQAETKRETTKEGQLSAC